MEGTIGEIRGFGGNFAPRAWAFCNGQLLAISQNQALFSILGTTYGGDGRTTFALPDLRGRAPISAGTGPGLSTRKLGARFGTETNTMTINQMPSHFHTASLGTLTGVGSLTGTATATMNVNDAAGAETTPNNNFLAGDNNAGGTYAATDDGTSTLNAGAISVDTSGLGVAVTNLTGNVTVAPTGNQQPFNNIQPVLTIYWVICLQGVFPSRS